MWREKMSTGLWWTSKPVLIYQGIALFVTDRGNFIVFFLHHITVKYNFFCWHGIITPPKSLSHWWGSRWMNNQRHISQEIFHIAWRGRHCPGIRTKQPIQSQGLGGYVLPALALKPHTLPVDGALPCPIICPPQLLFVSPLWLVTFLIHCLECWRIRRHGVSVWTFYIECEPSR